MKFKERLWLIAFALWLPRWLAPLAVWIINREIRRAERFLAPPLPKPYSTPWVDPYGIGAIGSAMMGTMAAKKAAQAQAAVSQANQELMAGLLNQTRPDTAAMLNRLSPYSNVSPYGNLYGGLESSAGNLLHQAALQRLIR